jgi:penicillin amidase
LNTFEAEEIPSMRMIVDLSNLQNSICINSTGQSGHAFHPNYSDMANAWRKIEYHPMNWTRSQIQAQSKNLLKLRP